MRKNTTRRYERRIIIPVLLVFGALLAFVLYPMAGAATFTVASEAETGTTAGAATKATLVNASGGQGVTFGGTSPGACLPQPGKQLQDQDFSDHQVAWERKGQPKVTINFETGKVDPEYLPYMEYGKTVWNKSPCLDVRLVPSCTGVANCVTVSMASGSESDGNFDSIERGGFTIGGHIGLYRQPLNEQGAGAKKNVTVHEMGHAVGLRHRLAQRVLMNGDTYTDVFDPDAIDYQNLLVLYGNQK